ncbi:MAG: cytochrome c oxidase subunit II [Terracidiphilus sp.]
MRMRLPSSVPLCRTAVVAAAFALAAPAAFASLPTSIFAPHSTPAGDVYGLSIFVLAITGGIFVVVATLILYALIRFRSRPTDTTEPPQVYGSMQIELSWTIIPILIIVMLFLTTARVLFSVQDAPKPAGALDVMVVGHQFWWEFRYPQYNVVTANELHVPVSSKSDPLPTFMTLTSADVMHSFWVPQLAGKTDVLPDRVNAMWIDPQKTGLYLGQCAQFCGAQHAKMLIRVYVDTPEDFRKWIAAQQKPQPELAAEQASLTPISNPGNGSPAAGVPSNLRGTVLSGSPEITEAITPQNGQLVFERQACISCHTIRGTVANGRYGPDLTHLMSRVTLGAGAALNTPGDLLQWIADPNTFKPGCLMPAMHLTDRQNQQITAYLLTLK